MARPTKLTRKLRDEIVACIELGCNIKVTCSYVGISTTAWKNWMIAGRDRNDSPNNRKYRSFRASVKRARATLELNCLTRINRAGMETRHWAACAWVLQNVVRGKYLKSAQALKPQINLNMSDIARDLEETEGDYFHSNGVENGNGTSLDRG